MSIRDDITHASLADVSRAAFLALDSLQDNKPGVQTAGVALMLYMLCRRYNEDPADVLMTASNRFNQGAARNNDHLQALAHYMKVDLPAS